MIGKVLALRWDRFVGIALPSPFSQNCAFSTKLCQLHFGSKREPLGLFARWAHQRNNLRRIWLNLRLENLQLSRGKWLLAGLIRSQCATRVFSGNTFCKIDKYTQEYLKKKTKSLRNGCSSVFKSNSAQEKKMSSAFSPSIKLHL